MTRKTKIKIRNFVRNSIAFICAFNILLGLSLWERLTTAGYGVAILLSGISLLYLGPYFYYNGFICDTKPWYEKEAKNDF